MQVIIIIRLQIIFADLSRSDAVKSLVSGTRFCDFSAFESRDLNINLDEYSPGFPCDG